MKALLFLALVWPALALACPDKIPSGMTAVTVAESVAVNTLGVSILQVQSKQSAASVLERLEKEWTEAGFDVRRNEAAGWDVLAALSEKCLVTLQLVERSGAFGYLAVNQRTTKVLKAPDVPAPPGAKELSNVVSDDDGRRAVTAVFSTSQSVNALAEYYKKRLGDEKWDAVKAVGTMGRDGLFAGAAVSAQRGRERIEVVIVREEGSKVVINLGTAL